MTGTVAVGGAVAGADITVIDANGNSASTTSDASGNYTASLAGLTAPYLVVASDPTGVHPTLYSVIASLPTGTTAPVIANVTTLSTAVAALLTTSGNPLDLSAGGSLGSQVSASAVSAAVAKLNSALAPILSANSLSATFDPVGTAFTANQTGADAVIDAVQVVPAPAGGTELISSAAPSTGIALSQATSVSAPLAVPPAPANYLSSLVSQLGPCLTGGSCAQAVDAGYLENGYTTFASAHPALAASGATLGSPETLEFLTGSGGAQEALVLLPYTTSTGTAGSAVTVVQKTGSGAWDIIGNQQQYNVTIASTFLRRQFLDTADAQYGRYESGLSLSIPVSAPNPASLASASVTGPGINGTAWLVPRNASGNDTLALTDTAQTAVPTGGVTTDSNTVSYRWSWQALPGDSATFTPGTSRQGYYTPTPIDVSTVPEYATYTVTFYNSAGAQIGQPMSVINTTPVLAASAGAGVGWQTLASSAQSGFLSPGGSQAGAQTSVTVPWSNLVNNQNIGPLVTRVEAEAVPATGPEVDGWWTGPASFVASGQYTAAVTAGVDQSGVQECTAACQFGALQSGSTRLIQLNWDIGETSYYNIWSYND